GVGDRGQPEGAAGEQFRRYAARHRNPAEQHFAPRLRCGKERRAVPEQRDVWLRTALQELRGSLGDEVTRRGIGARCGEPLGVLTFLGTPVDVGTGEEIRALTLLRSLRRSWGCAGDSNPAGFQTGVIQPECVGTEQWVQREVRSGKRSVTMRLPQSLQSPRRS